MSQIFSQELPEIIPPSPTVANLMQFEEVPISYYTGQPNINIPIYSKSITSDLGVNISLSYNTQGVQVNNISGWTGTSWSLIAGGTVSRTVRGEPDEITITTSTTNKTGIYHLDHYWNYDNLTLAQKKEFNYKVSGHQPSDKFDETPDLYQFNFMGHSGRFVILKEGTNLVPKMINRTDNFKVDITYNLNYVIEKFIFRDTKGYIYTFDVVETSLTTPFTGSTPQGDQTNPAISADAASDGYSVNTAWHLSKIEKSNGEDLLLLVYQNISESYNASVNRTSSEIINFGSAYNDLISNAYNQGILTPKESVTYQSLLTGTEKLQKMVFVRDNIEIDFNIDQNYTHPENNGRVLDNITIKKGVTVNKTFNLTYDETQDTSIVPLVFKRLWLTKVTEVAGGIELDYDLQYHSKENLPGFNKNDIRGDGWGYYSGIDLGVLNCDVVSSNYNENIIKTGLLNSITYPTGGVKEFVFEHNSYSYFQNQPITYDDYIVNPRNLDPETEVINNFVYNHTGQSANPVPITTFILDFAQDIQVHSEVTANPSQYLSSHIIRIHNSGYQAFVNLNETCGSLINVPPGTYTMELASSGSLITDPYQISGFFRVHYLIENTSIKQEMIGGGVRIKEIKFKNSPFSANDKRIQFDYSDQDFSNRSSGVIDSEADRLERVYSVTKSHYVFTNEINVCGSFMVQPIEYMIREKNFNAELSQGSYVGYRHVKVIEEGNGYKTYSFTSPYEYPSDPYTFSYEQPYPKANLDYKRGLITNEITYNELGEKLIEISYLDENGNPNYEFDEVFLYKERAVYKPDCPLLPFYSNYTFYLSGTIENQPPCTIFSNNPEPCGPFILFRTDFKSGWAKLLGTTTKEYFYNDLNVQHIKETRQSFVYNPLNFQIQEQNTYFEESGTEQQLKTKYYYPLGGVPSNYNNNAMITRLTTLNKINEVVTTENYKNGVMLSQTQTQYFEPMTDLVLPQKVKTLKGSNTTEDRIQFYKYDIYGNPLDVSKTNGTRISYIWGYNHSYPVAKLEGVTFAQIETLLGANFNAGSGTLTPQQITSLKNAFPNAMISTYTYDPLVGVTSMTDPKGYTMYYEYDEFNRLKQVKDAEGNILSKNEYNYATQN